MDSAAREPRRWPLALADRSVARLASRQYGLATYGQLRHLGLSRKAIGHRRDRGRLHVIHAGVFAVGHDALTDRGRLLAAVMACGPEALLSHNHAARLWGILPDWLEVDMATIHVTVPATSRRGRRAGVSVHRTSLDAAERTMHHRIPVTSPARSVLDLATIAGERTVERALDQIVTGRLATPGEVRRVVTRYAGGAGARALRAILDAAVRFDSLTRSELEERFLRIVRAARLTEPRLNAPVAGLIVDAVWHAERVAVELDGYRWHRTRHRMESDRGREATLRREGWYPLRYSARQVFDEPLLVIADLASVLAERRALATSR